MLLSVLHTPCFNPSRYNRFSFGRVLFSLIPTISILRSILLVSYKLTKYLIASLLRHQPWAAKHSTTCACGWTAVLFIFKRARPTATKVTCDCKRPALLRTARSRIVLCAKYSRRFDSIPSSELFFRFLLTWPPFHWIPALVWFFFLFFKLRSSTDRPRHSTPAFPWQRLPLFVRLAHFAEHSVRLRRMTSDVWAQLLAGSIYVLWSSNFLQIRS